MSLISFIKEAGEKLFGTGEAKAQDASPADGDKVAAANTKAADAIKHYISTLQLAPPDLTVSFDGASGTVTVAGTAPDQASRERIVLAAGNVQGVNQVDDKLTVSQSEPAATFYTVARGDTLSAISKKHYGDANKYQKIFEANRPMLSHPDKIYPGQVLRIPPAA
ncbi:peptidoglycan-binding protein LysM [Azoarcus olearius]|uniref:Potassium binding protein Kbp n=1 Tax=Azoarcus sp. (strain BH72) TaxID=418699 RepID=A1KC30_AZOSB|nr:peptidoglycan-binding protein LysM [Azoarcus olearius]ANQ86938.1 LysM domain/BON superfamily protein [Azoarcus olearius]CAL96386.1 conserved hypothetical protein [Azoarcus olearius]